MGQESNSGRNASLDDKKRRAAGRQDSDSPEGEAIRDFSGMEREKGRAGGAFGKTLPERKIERPQTQGAPSGE